MINPAGFIAGIKCNGEVFEEAVATKNSGEAELVVKSCTNCR